MKKSKTGGALSLTRFRSVHRVGMLPETQDMKANNKSLENQKPLNRESCRGFLFILPCHSVYSVDNLRALLLFFAILLASAFSAPALDSSELSFTWNEANAIMAAAKAPEDFLDAARVYQKLVDAGVRNGPLFYNLGTALLQAGRYDNALDALARAERYLGAQPDIRRNMGIALARKQKTPAAAWPWYRILLFWHFMLAGATRAMITVLAFTLFWLSLTLLRLGPRRGMNTLAILSILACIAFGSSVVTTVYQELTARRYTLDIPFTPSSTTRP